MIRAPLSTTSVLDESADVVRMTAAPWAGLLILASLPYRFLQVLFFDQVIELGSSAGQYGDALRATAYWTAAAFVLSRCGRAMYARACRLGMARGQSPGWETFRVPLAALLGYLFVSSLTELTTYMTLLTFLGPLVAAMVSGLAIGTMELNEQSGVRAPLRLIAHHGRNGRILGALTLVFLVALAVAAVNILAAFQAGLWLVSSIGGFDIPRWTVLLSGANRRYGLMIFAGAALAVEPFWVAANVVLVRKAGAQETGDDLRTWFEELRRAS